MLEEKDAEAPSFNELWTQAVAAQAVAVAVRKDAERFVLGPRDIVTGPSIQPHCQHHKQTHVAVVGTAVVLHYGAWTCWRFRCSHC